MSTMIQAQVLGRQQPFGVLIQTNRLISQTLQKIEGVSFLFFTEVIMSQ